MREISKRGNLKSLQLISESDTQKSNFYAMPKRPQSSDADWRKKKEGTSSINDTRRDSQS